MPIMCLKQKAIHSESGTVLLWVVGIFSVSLLVLAALISVAGYFSSAVEWQSRVELALTNASDQITLSAFETSGDIQDIYFDESLLLDSVLNEVSEVVKRPKQISINYFKCSGREVWIELAYPWKSPIGDFKVLPTQLVAKAHLTLDSNRHLQ